MSCLTSCVKLTDLPPYVALSYSWDGQERVYWIAVNGKILLVTANVLEFFALLELEWRRVTAVD